ncbi:MAG: phage/plasmid primase, P4 family [Smithella sp.]
MGIALKHLSESERAQIARSLFKVTSPDKNRGELIGLCPIHGESNPSFSYNYQKDVYNCASCNASGDLLKLWSEVKGYGQKEGFKAFCTEYGIKLKNDDDHYHRSAGTPKNQEKVCNLPKNEQGACSHVWGMCDEKKCCNNCTEVSCGSRCANSTPASSPAPGELTHEQVIEQMNRAWEKFPVLPAAMIARMEKERGWSPSVIEMLDLRFETWRMSKKGELYQVQEPVKIAIPIRNTSGNLINIRLYQPGAKEYKIISFGKTTGKSALFPEGPQYSDKPVLLTEGESDTICALSHGFNAITQTSKLINWPKEHLAPFKDRDVIIAYDADAPGQKYARAAAEALTGTAKSVRMLLWPAFMGIDESGAIPDKHGQDLTDFFVRHGKTADDLQALVDAAAPWPPEPVKISEPICDNIQPPTSSSDGKKQEKADSIEDTNDVLQFYDHGVNNRFSFKPRLLAEKIMQDHKLMYCKDTGDIYRWNGKFWDEYDESYLRKAAIDLLRNEAKKGMVDDAVYQIKNLVTIPHGRALNDQLDWICIQNGILNLKTFELLPHDPDCYFTSALPVSFNPDSTDRCTRWEQFLLETIETPGPIAQLQEFFGYCLVRHAKYQKCLFLLGPGEDGKSKTLDILKEMIGEINCAAVSFGDLEKEFHRSSLYHKMLNISTEIGAQAIESPYFKAITSGDPISAAFKNVDNFTFSPYVKLAFAGNSLPRVRDNSHGYFRRFMPIQYKNQFFEDDPRRDPDLMDKLRKELPEIFFWAICGLKRLTEQKRFTNCDETRSLMMKYRRSNNPILCYIEDECELGPEMSVLTDDLYSDYKTYAGRNGYSIMNKENFFRELYVAQESLRRYRPNKGGERLNMVKGISIHGKFNGDGAT